MMNRARLGTLLSSRHFLLAAYLVATLGATAVQYFKGRPGDAYTPYNNYIIFKESYNHLAAGKDLYAAHPDDHFDLYKYSPAFAVIFAPLGTLNDAAGLTLWNLLNSLPLFFLIWFIRALPDQKKPVVLWIVLFELITSVQNSQSNGLVAALAFGAFLSFERKNVFLAALLIVLSAYIKVFGIATGLLFLFYGRRVRFMIYAFTWTAVLALLPLLFTSFELLVMQYRSWFQLLLNDQSVSNGISAYGLVFAAAGDSIGKGMLLVMGTVLLLLPAMFFQRYYNSRFRLLYLAVLLMWVVLFNHRAESPSYVIAVTGMAVWYALSGSSALNNALLFLVCVLTILSPTDLFPRVWREAWVVPYSLKALPCMLIWMKATWELMFNKDYAVPG